MLYFINPLDLFFFWGGGCSILIPLFLFHLLIEPFRWWSLSYILVSTMLIKLNSSHMVSYFLVLSRRMCNSTGPDQWTRKGSDEYPKGLEDPAKRSRTAAACFLGKTEQWGDNDLCLLIHIWTALSCVFKYVSTSHKMTWDIKSFSFFIIFTERWIQHPDYSIYAITRRIYKREIESNFRKWNSSINDKRFHWMKQRGL